MTLAGTSGVQQGSSRFMQILFIPWVDKTIAIIAVLPNIVELYYRYFRSELNFPRFVLSIQILIMIITMVIRRTPVRVTPNPLFWLLAFVATYGLLAFTAFAPNGIQVGPPLVTYILASVAGAIFIYARVSLGRSIGFVPANRGIITTGAYRFVRHPIYTGIFLAMVSYVLRSYSPVNLILAATIVVLFMIKSVVEESFLCDDAEYAAYMQSVRSRWVPGVA
jgi:protein-S-isoprenylcysteine O-methyltransferase Ste14